MLLFQGPSLKTETVAQLFLVSREKLSFRIFNNELNWPEIVVEHWLDSADVLKLTCYIFLQNF